MDGRRSVASRDLALGLARSRKTRYVAVAASRDAKFSVLLFDALSPEAALAYPRGDLICSSSDGKGAWAVYETKLSSYAKKRVFQVVDGDSPVLRRRELTELTEETPQEDEDPFCAADARYDARCEDVAEKALFRATTPTHFDHLGYMRHFDDVGF